MSFPRPESCWLASPPPACVRWHRELIESPVDMERVIGQVLAAMDAAGYGQREVFAARLALDEALVNAVKHGHQGDFSKPVRVSYHVGDDGMAVEVEDQGKGFDPGDVPDPLACENVERSCGRGLFLMRCYMSGCCFNQRGNAICLCKHRQVPSAEA